MSLLQIPDVIRLHGLIRALPRRHPIRLLLAEFCGMRYWPAMEKVRSEDVLAECRRLEESNKELWKLFLDLNRRKWQGRLSLPPPRPPPRPPPMPIHCHWNSGPFRPPGIPC